MRENQSNEKDVAFKPKEKNGRGFMLYDASPFSSLLVHAKSSEISEIIMLHTKRLSTHIHLLLFFLLKYKLLCVGNLNLFAQRKVDEYRGNFETVLEILPPKLECRFYFFRYFNLSFLLFFNWILN